MGLDISLIRITSDRSKDKMLISEEDAELSKRYGHLKETLTEDYGDGPETTFIYYYESLAYQRKGVTREFFYRYGPDDFLFTKEQLDELEKFIDQENITSFRRNFVENFVEHDTIIDISY